jgi:hypothetical protein
MSAALDRDNHAESVAQTQRTVAAFREAVQAVLDTLPADAPPGELLLAARIKAAIDPSRK